MCRFPWRYGGTAERSSIRNTSTLSSSRLQCDGLGRCWFISCGDGGVFRALHADLRRSVLTALTALTARGGGWMPRMPQHRSVWGAASVPGCWLERIGQEGEAQMCRPVRNSTSGLNVPRNRLVDRIAAHKDVAPNAMVTPSHTQCSVLVTGSALVSGCANAMLQPRREHTYWIGTVPVS